MSVKCPPNSSGSWSWKGCAKSTTWLTCVLPVCIGASRKRPILCRSVTDKYGREVPAEFIGKLVMEGLRQIDDVAYVRFASVYRRFQEATDFVHEVKKLEAK